MDVVAVMVAAAAAAAVVVVVVVVVVVETRLGDHQQSVTEERKLRHQCRAQTNTPRGTHIEHETRL
jgi:hypothetical protein